MFNALRKNAIIIAAKINNKTPKHYSFSNFTLNNVVTFFNKKQRIVQYFSSGFTNFDAFESVYVVGVYDGLR